MQFPEATLTAAAHPKDILTGYVVGPGDRVICTECRREVRESHAVAVYAYRLVDAPLWDVPRCYCERCAPGTITTPTLGATEVLATAILGACADPFEQTHRLALTDVDVVAYAGPDAGAEP